MMHPRHISQCPRLLLLLLVLVLPLGIEAQDSTSDPSFAPSRLGGGTEIPAESLGVEGRVFLGVLDAIRDHSIQVQGDSVLWERAIEGLVRELGDPYAEVLSPDQVRRFEEQSTGNYAGIGIQISDLNKAITVIHVFPGTPAEDAGLLAGDRIIGVDSEMSEQWTTSDASARIRGEAGTTVVVHIERDGIDQPIEKKMNREEVHISAVRSETIFGDIAYVELNRVTRNSASEVEEVLSNLGDVRGLILDLRRNPGGYLDESLNLADLFLERGSVLARTRSRVRGSNGDVREESARARLRPRVAGLPIIVLVDRYSASAAEIVAGALQDHDRALVLGERTFGKGTVQSILPLPEGRRIRLTSGEWYTPQGRSLNRPRDSEGTAIEPDSLLEFTSVGGRQLVGGGGVFPDLVIEDRALTPDEEAFLAAMIEAEISLGQRVQEAAFNAALRVRDASDDDGSFPQEAFQAFVATFEDHAHLITPEVEDYLRWNLEDVFHQRLDRLARHFEVRTQRDDVLATAVGLLKEASSQEDLFALGIALEESRRAAAAEAEDEKNGA